MPIPPTMARTVVVASGTRTRNSPDAFAAINAPMNRPITSRVPQFKNFSSPVVMKETACALGVVIPRPSLRPVAAESGHAITPRMPMSVPAV